MKSELKSRINTSILLLIIIYICIFINLYISLISLTIISIFSWIEFTRMTNKIYTPKQEYVANLILILSSFYFIIFTGISYYIIEIDRIYFFYLISICAFSDIGGYAIGKIFKGKKLTKISPNKTISGSFGSFIFAMIPCFILKTIFLYTEIYSLSFEFTLTHNFS